MKNRLSTGTPLNVRSRAELALQSGDFHQARSLYEKIVKKNSKDANLWLALGFICGQLGELKTAIEHLTKACRLQPDIPQTHYNLGVAYQSRRDYGEAIKSFRRALRLDPGFKEAHFNLAMCLQGAHDYDAAIEIFRTLSASQPRDELLLVAQASAHFETGDYTKAIELAEQATQLNKRSAKAYCLIGAAQLSIHLDENARESLQTSLKIDPTVPEANLGLGEYYLRQKNLEKSVGFFKAALQHRPDQSATLIKLGSIFIDLGRPDEALDCYTQALGLEKQSSDAFFGLANAQEMLGQWDDAVATYRKMLKIGVRHEEAQAGLAHILERKHKTDEAMELLTPLLAFDEPCVSAICTFANLSRENKCYEDAIKHCEGALTRPHATERDRCLLHFSLGKLYNDTRQYSDAFRHFQKGNELEKKLHWHDYVPEKQSGFVDWSIEQYSPGAFNLLPRSSLRSKRPVFVVGMPRSGTSLVEQIISSHPEAYGAGELTNVYDFAQSLPENIGNIKNEPLATTLQQLTQERLDAFATDYLDKLSTFSTNAKRVVDKMPGNFLYLGLIELAFPDAYILHCKRNPIDTCLSIYFQQFTSSQSYATDLRALGHYYSEYLRLMEHWKSACSKPILEINYESLIESPDKLIQEIISFIGLEWNDQCLEFHRNKRDVNTPSYQQVRKPIYSSSVERWRNYSADIDDLLEALAACL